MHQKVESQKEEDDTGNKINLETIMKEKSWKIYCTYHLLQSLHYTQRQIYQELKDTNKNVKVCKKDVHNIQSIDVYKNNLKRHKVN